MISPNCKKCGRPATVTLDLGGSTTMPTSAQYLSYCEPCALQVIPTLPPCEHLLMIAATLPMTEEDMIWKTYQVCGLIPEMNLAKIRPIKENHQPVHRPAITIRCDTIPPNSRKPGESFSIGGNALEIKLFENSAPENRGYDITGPEATN